MLGTRLFKSTCSEIVRLIQNWQTMFPKYGGAPACWNRPSQGSCGTVQCSNMSTCEWLVAVAYRKKEGPMMLSLIMPHPALAFGVSLWCSIFSWDVWLPHILQLCLFTMSIESNVASSERTHMNPGKSHHCQFSTEFPHKFSSCSHGPLVPLRRRWPRNTLYPQKLVLLRQEAAVAKSA
jgi:hypothetical protein